MCEWVGVKDRVCRSEIREYRLTLDERYVDSWCRIKVYSNVNVASKGQNFYAFDRNAELTSYCEPTLKVCE